MDWGLLDDDHTSLPSRGFVLKHRRQVRAAGWTMLALGVAALLFPLFFTMATTYVVGWLLLMVGAITLYHALCAVTWDASALSTGVAIFYLAGGVILLTIPQAGSVGVTAIMAIAFVVRGGVEWILSRKRRPRYGWQLVRASAVASVILGTVLFWVVSDSAGMLLGTILGLNILLTGVSFLAVVYLPNNTTG